MCTNPSNDQRSAAARVCRIPARVYRRHQFGGRSASNLHN